MKIINVNTIIILFTMIIILPGCGGGSSNQPEDTNYLYSFDEESGVTVNSTSTTSQTGQISGAIRATGKVNKALYFGNDLPSYVELPLFTEYPENELTLEAWIKFESLDPGLVYHFYGDQHYGHKSFRMDIIDSQFRFMIYTASGLGAPIEILRTNYTFGVDTWYYIAFTYGGSGAKFYVNGVINNSSSILTGIPKVANKQYLGSFEDTSDILYGYRANSFPGYIDEFRGFNIELTSDEITTHYNDTL